MRLIFQGNINRYFFPCDPAADCVFKLSHLSASCQNVTLFSVSVLKKKRISWVNEGGVLDTVMHVSNAGQWKKVALKGFNKLECFVRNSKYKYHFCLLARKPHRVAFVSCCNDFPPKVVFVTESQSNVRSAEVRALLMTLIWSDFHTVCNAVSFHLPLWSLLMFFCAWINHKKAQERSRSYIKNILL